MNTIKYLLATVFVLTVLLISCSSEELPDTGKSVIRIDNEKQSQFDKFLNKKFIEPYNVRLLYKYVDVESDLDYTLVPADYKNSVKMANLIRYLCFEPYDKVAPQNFLKKYFPKMITLIGSSAYKNNGSRVLGTAKGGVKMALYDINNLDVTDINKLNRFYFRTIYHEFSHILHQNKSFSTDFDKITEKSYVGESWNESWSAKNPSNAAGYISDYSSKEPKEDFVELIAHYITNTQTSWDKKITDAGDKGGPLIQRKMTIVKTYLQNVWKINIDDLRDEIQERTKNLDKQDLDNINF